MFGRQKLHSSEKVLDNLYDALVALVEAAPEGERRALAEALWDAQTNHRHVFQSVDCLSFLIDGVLDATGVADRLEKTSPTQAA